jgi:hypothetical protein
MLTRLPGLPSLPRGQRIEIDVIDCDEIELSLQARLHQVLTLQATDTVDEDELADEIPTLDEGAGAEVASTSATAGAALDAPVADVIPPAG